ncbi:hypothetical protein ADUPG1_012877 [Aduncisulcus paluster]|uniref:Uncharacterized protein n=1 Tax=Aduncisulcus paluster TaxID=2918883 RepID=A0ABQ5K0Z9_9EUKA|nr:hypothetical protein ADUPG1_012877 [Aduncisulcus paluster]
MGPVIFDPESAIIAKSTEIMIETTGNEISPKPNVDDFQPPLQTISLSQPISSTSTSLKPKSVNIDLKPIERRTSDVSPSFSISSPTHVPKSDSMTLTSTSSITPLGTIGKGGFGECNL